MIESAIRAERVELPSSAVPFYLWDVPQKPVCVKLPFALIDRLEHEAVESFRSLSSRGSEIGGVLLGSFSPGNPTIVTLQDYELIACDYSRGPLYRLSDADLDRFDRAFAQHTAAGRPVVGFFRSHTRKGIQLDPEDITLLDSRFSAPHQIALLIRPFATKPSAAGIYIREDGAIRSETAYKEFAFRASQLTPSEEPVQVERPAAPPPPVSTPTASSTTSKPAPRAQIVPIAKRHPVPAATPEPVTPPVAAPPPAPPPAPVAAAPPAPPAETKPAVETKAAPKSASPKVAPPPAEPVAPPKVEKEAPKKEPKPEVERAAVVETASPLTALEAEPRRGGKGLFIIIGVFVAMLAGVLLFIWPGVLVNRGAKPPVTAQQDSSALELRVQRAGGELVLIWNRDSDVVRNAAHAVLNISDGDRQENAQLDIDTLRSGSITYTPATGDVVFKLEVTGKDQAKTSSAQVRALQMRPSPMPQGQEQAAAPTKTTPAATPAEPAPAPAVEEAPAAKAPERPLRQFRPETALAQRLRPSNAADLPDAPSLGAAPAVGAPPISSLNMGSSPAPPPSRAQAPAAPAASAAKPINSGGNIVQAQLISKKDPEYPKIARDAGAKGVVDLIATIGADGRVKSVKVLRGHPMLQKAASDAVMQWVYKPTLLNGTPVEGQVQVAVNFLGR